MQRVLDEVEWGREMGTERGKRGGEVSLCVGSVFRILEDWPEFKCLG